MIPERPLYRSCPASAQPIGKVSLGTAILLLVALACAPPVGAGEEIAGTAAPLDLDSTPTQCAISLAAEAQARLARALAQAGPGAVALRFEGIRTSSQPGGYYEVYLELPATPLGGTGEPAAVPDPGPESPHYAGNLSLFGLGTEPGGAGGVQDLAVAAAIRRLRAGGLWSEGELTLTLVPRGATGSVRIERIALTVE